MNDSEVILGLLKSLCGEVAELRMAVEERNAKKKNYTFDEAREYLRISRTTMHERMRRGEFPWAVKRGKSWLFPFDKLKKICGQSDLMSVMRIYLYITVCTVPVKCPVF